MNKETRQALGDLIGAHTFVDLVKAADFVRRGKGDLSQRRTALAAIEAMQDTDPAPIT